jgi:hypothetical protein
MTILGHFRLLTRASKINVNPSPIDTRVAPGKNRFLSLFLMILFWNFGIVETERMVIMKSFKYVVYRDGEYFVSQCLNLDIASFGTSVDDAVENLKDAVSLYLADEDTA